MTDLASQSQRTTTGGRSHRSRANEVKSKKTVRIVEPEPLHKDLPEAFLIAERFHSLMHMNHEHLTDGANSDSAPVEKKKSSTPKEMGHKTMPGPLASQGMSPDMGPPIHYSLGRGNPLGPYGFELKIQPPILSPSSKYKKQVVIMTVQDVQRVMTNVTYVPGESGALAHTTLVYRNMGVSDIDVLTHYVHLRYVYLPHNRITSLQPLAKMQSLSLLDVGHNELGKAADVPLLESLSAVNFWGNNFETLTGFPLNQCVYVCFNYNILQNLDGLVKATFTALVTLEIRGNDLPKLGTLDLPNLMHLFAAENNLCKFNELKNLTNLVSIHFRSNCFQLLEDFPRTLAHLKYLNLRDNQVDRFTQIRFLARSPLQCLVLIDNPVRNSLKYRLETTSALLTLKRLDKALVSEVEVDAAVLLRKGRMAHYIPPIRDDVVSATPPPTPQTDQSDMSEHEVIVNTLNKAMENVNVSEGNTDTPTLVKMRSNRSDSLKKVESDLTMFDNVDKPSASGNQPLLREIPLDDSLHQAKPKSKSKAKTKGKSNKAATEPKKPPKIIGKPRSNSKNAQNQIEKESENEKE